MRQLSLKPTHKRRFQKHCQDESITKWDIFYYIYAVLHHPEYRSRYAANLRRELPRIPFVGAATCGEKGKEDGSDSVGTGRAVKHAAASKQKVTDATQRVPTGHDDDAAVFHEYARIGKDLADLHVNYEEAPEYSLKHVETKDMKLDWRVEKMRLNRDKAVIHYNDFLTLEGVPSKALEYRLGNRSALEWVIGQYQVSTDTRSGIVNDPNRKDESDYIVKLLGKVITVSLETQKLVAELPELDIWESSER